MSCRTVKVTVLPREREEKKDFVDQTFTKTFLSLGLGISIVKSNIGIPRILQSSDLSQQGLGSLN